MTRPNTPGWFSEDSFETAARGLELRTRNLPARLDCQIALGRSAPLPPDTRGYACERVARELARERAMLARVAADFLAALAAAHPGTVRDVIAASPERRDASLLPALARAEQALRAALAPPGLEAAIARLGAEHEPPSGRRGRGPKALGPVRRSWWRHLFGWLRGGR